MSQSFKSQPSRQIIALGGGGFSTEPNNLLLDQYILEQCRLAPHASATPKICFLPTASGDSDHYITRFYNAFTQLNCQPSHLSLFRPPSAGVEAHLRSQHIIYIGGGSTFNLITLLRAWKLDQLLKALWEQGTLLAGLSAGSMCWFEEALSDSRRSGCYSKLNGLGLIPGSHCPHYDVKSDGKNQRRPSYQQQILEGTLAPGIAADDGVGLHYRGDSLHKVVSSRPTAKAYRVYVEDKQLKEAAIAPEYLG